MTRVFRAAPREIVQGVAVAVAFIFPGQGSQAVGMGKALAEASGAARAVFAEIDEALSQDLSKLMWEGPEDELALTENAQPALMTVSLAVIRALESDYGIVVANIAKYVAGHSLGEYSALAAAGTFSLADTARLLKVRSWGLTMAMRLRSRLKRHRARSVRRPMTTRRAR